MSKVKIKRFKSIINWLSKLSYFVKKFDFFLKRYNILNEDIFENIL